MKHILFLFAFAIVLFACNNNTDEKPVNFNPPVAVKDTPAIQKGCYAYINKKDTVFMSITISDKNIIGDLVFNFFEKDRNTGIISGQMRGDTMVVDYVFEAEGMTSTRQEVFLKKGNDLLQGNGDAEQKGDKWIYKNIAALDFSKGLLLQHVTCKN